MNLPTIFDILDRFDFLRGLPAAYVVLTTAVIVTIVWDWRLMLLALMVQYLAAGFLFVDLLEPYLVFVKVLVGLFVTLILYMTARQVNWGRLPIDVTEEEAKLMLVERRIRIGPYLLPTTKTFRVFLMLMILLVVITLVRIPDYQLPGIPVELNYLNLASYGLLGIGLLSMGLTSEPLQVGVGILIFLMGFELFYSTLEQSVLVLALLAAVNLVITLAISYLIQVRHAIPSLVE